jgi:2-oxoisovalerate dehydrogenase E1 component
MALDIGRDWFYPYYRDRALCLTLGVTPEQMLLQALGAASDPASGGRQMPSHWSDPHLHIVTGSSPTGTQFVQAAGCAHASAYRNAGADEVTLVCTGDGATSEGEFWEMLNTACLEKLPLLFLVEDNGFAISTPVECQTPGGSISKLVQGFPHLFVTEVDGCDFLASYKAMGEAVAWCRGGNGPALVHAHVIRPYSHSLSDDERLYKTAAERAAEAERDPISRFPEYLIDQGILDRPRLQQMLAKYDREIQEATDRALAAPPPARGSALEYLYSPKIDPTSDAIPARAAVSGRAAHDG